MTDRAGATETFWDSASDDAALRRYETLVNAVDDGIYQLDAAGRFEAVDDAFVEMTGHDREDLLGEHVSLVFPADAARIDRAVRRQFASGEGPNDTLELAAHTADGRTLPLELRLRPLVEDGDFRGTIGVARDVSERERAERELRRERDLLERVLETSPVGVVVLEADGEVTRVNERARELLDVSARERTAFSSVRPTYDEAGRELSIDEHPFATALETGEAVSDRLLEVERPGGESRWLSVSAVPLFDEDGAVDRVVTTGEDVTALKERTRELERRSDRLSTELAEVFERVSDAVYAVDEEWRFTHVNERAEDLLGRPAEELLGEVVWDVFPDARGTRGYEAFHRALETQEPTSYEERLPSLGKWFDVRAYPSETGLSVYFRDITGRKERERALAESERRYQTLVDNFPNGAVGMFDEDLRYRFLGGEIFDGLASSVDEFEGRTVREMLPDAMADEIEPRYRAVFDGERSEFEVEFGGEVRHFRVVPVYDEDGTVVAGLGMSQDVTDRVEYERQLEEYRRWSETFVEHYPSGAVALVDEDLRYVTFGGTVEADANLNREDLEGELVRDALPSHVADVVVPAYEAALDGEATEFEDVMEGRTYQFHFLPVRDAAGEVFAVTAMSQDVTERKERMRQLEESRQRYRTLVDNFPNGIVTLFDEELRYLVAGGELYETFDMTPEETMGKTLYERSNDEEIELLEPHYRAALAGESHTFEVEYAGLSLRFWTVPVTDESGAVFAGMAMSQDVTERKEYERYLEEAKAQLEAATEAGAVGTWEYRIPEDRFAAGGSFARTFGVDPAAAREGVSLDRFVSAIHEADRERVEREIEAAVEACGEYESEYRVRDADGDLRWVVARGHVECDADGEPVTFPGALTDITERKEYQRKLEESNERLEQFAYSASHDLQEPLRMVSSYLQLIDRRYGDELDADGREFLGYAVDGADRMREMIDGLLAYSRVETRGDPFEAVDLTDVVEDVREDLRIRIEESGAEIAVGDLPRVDGDASQLREVFQNLLSNAIAYSGDEPPRVEIDAERAGGRWRIAVRDEGVGIAPDEQERIFEVFQRLHGRDEHPGTGIGLALCRRIVERHGGEIRVDSDPGEGSVFTVTLPAADR
ncbi:PAS domain-containing protein [Salinilacihabitans rarus]|uniref:PAS domain-containing protein n=1 Tax=Salinilacihabitans rarus TaxID=2961596 RepID=UPI0020C8AD03|nr:PAS domain-containing protein [Salinilacihabitans rarus]